MRYALIYGLLSGMVIMAVILGGSKLAPNAAIRSLGLTTRECEILGHLASGQSTKELARTFAISPNTVKTHLARVFEKLEVQNRMQAVEKARWLALIP